MMTKKTVANVRRGLSKMHFTLQKNIVGVAVVVDDVAMRRCSIATECLFSRSKI
jgi:hypothetical protein